MKRPEGKDRKEITVDGITYTLWTEERQPECSCAVEYMDERAFFAGNGQCFYAQAVSCEDVEGEVVIPEEVEGHSVMSLAPYAFSAKRMESLILPVTLREAGRYVFYRSFRLKKLCFSDTFTDIGAGAFTGCRLEEIEIDFYQGEQSCLKFIVDEIRYALWVTLRYHRSDGRIDTAKVVFPEWKTHRRGLWKLITMELAVITGRPSIIRSLILRNMTRYFRWRLLRRMKKS